MQATYYFQKKEINHCLVRNISQHLARFMQLKFNAVTQVKSKQFPNCNKQNDFHTKTQIMYTVFIPEQVNKFSSIL